MTIKLAPAVRPGAPKLGKEERAEAFIAEGDSPRAQDAMSELDAVKTVVNSRWDAKLLRRIDEAAKRQGISRTAWLHVAAAEKLER